MLDLKAMNGSALLKGVRIFYPPALRIPQELVGTPRGKTFTATNKSFKIAITYARSLGVTLVALPDAKAYQAEMGLSTPKTYLLFSNPVVTGDNIRRVEEEFFDTLEGRA